MSDTNTEDDILLDRIIVSTMLIDGQAALTVHLSENMPVITALGMLDAARMYIYRKAAGPELRTPTP